MDPADAAALKDAQALLASLTDWKAGPEHTGPVEREIERLQARGDCPVHEDNWDAVMLFCEMETQWMVAAGFGGALRLGIHYPAAESVMRMRRVPPARRAALLDDLQLMERAALVALREERLAAAQARATEAH